MLLQILFTNVYSLSQFLQQLTALTHSGVAKAGNGWAQAQPIISSAQPISHIYCTINLIYAYISPHNETLYHL